MDAVSGSVYSALGMRQERLMLEAAASIMRQGLDVQEQGMAKLLETMAPMNPPHLGNQIDIKA